MDKFVEFFDVLLQTVVLGINLILVFFSCLVVMGNVLIIFGVLAFLLYLVGAVCSLSG